MDINYYTQWKHPYLEPDDYLYFEPNTPIETIVPRLQNHLNGLYRDLNLNYEKPSITYGFSRLYRNLLSHYKGWHVLYRNIKSKKQDYSALRKRLSSRQPKQSMKQTIFKNTMLWTHDLYPLINRVELKNTDSCQAIAQRLNHQVSQPNYQEFLNSLQRNLDDLSKNVTILNQQLVLPDSPNHELCQTIDQNLEKMYHRYYKKIHLFRTKNYHVGDSSISEI